VVHIAKQGEVLNSKMRNRKMMEKSEKSVVRQIVGLVVLALVTLTVPAVAQTSNVVSIPDGLTATPGGNVTTSIMLENSTGVGSVDITLRYNASVVNVTGATVGDFTYYFEFDNTNAANGWITIDTYITGGDLTGNLTIANVTLEAVGDPGDSSPLNLEIDGMGNQYGDVNGTADNGSFVIQIQAVVTSCNINGTETNAFAPGESVYVKSSGLAPNTDYKIWLQDNPVNESDSLISGEDDSGPQENVATDENGDFGPTEIWVIPGGASVTHHEYDLIIDSQESGTVGTYNAASDGIDSATVAGIVAPVPELPTILLFSLGLLVMAGYVWPLKRTG
jgi:hypothetical protein